MADANAAIPTEDVPRGEPVQRQLNNAEAHWIWKAGLRAILCVLNIIAIGMAAWVLATPSVLDGNPYLYYFEFNDSALGGIIVLGISLIWCLVWITIPLLLKPPRPLHPGIAVGFDLLLWLGFLVVALFSVAGILSIAQFGSDSYIEDPNPSYGSREYSGSYYLASNGTWVYNITYTNYDYNNYTYNETTGQYDYTQFDPSTVVRDCTPQFTSCTEQDQYFNSLWHEKPKRYAIEVIISVVEWLGLLLHFTLFVWACVDTHRHNRKKSASKEQIVADRIIADLERRGLISVQNGVITQSTAATQPEMTQQSSVAPQLPVRPPVNSHTAEDNAIPSTTREV